MDEIKLGWGLNRLGSTVHISDVKRGKKCECFCLDCGTPLIARQGKKVVWHFAHAVSIECFGEGVLHRAAKEILEDLAQKRNLLYLPQAQGVVTLKDIRNQSHNRSWEYKPDYFYLESARQEVRVRSDLIADLVVHNGNHSMAVEIYVTHKKTEIEEIKYQEEKLSCIEIDLRMLEWNATYEEIKSAILQSASRRWVFCNDVLHLICEAEERLKKDILESERIEWHALKRYCHHLSLGNVDWLNEYSWPEIKGSYKDNSNTDVTVVEVHQPSITTILDNWTETDQYFCVTAVINGKTHIRIYFVLRGISKDIFYDSGTALIIWANINERGEISGDSCLLEWVGIEHWIDKLVELSKIKYKIQIDKKEKIKRANKDFADKFKKLNHLEKLQFLANKINLPPPVNAGSFSEAWNTTWPVWKSLVWHYKIVKNQGDVVLLESLANDSMFLELLGWPTDDFAIKKRQKNLWFWFKELEVGGLVSHQGWQQFLVADQLPLDVIPWARSFKKY